MFGSTASAPSNTTGLFGQSSSPSFGSNTSATNSGIFGQQSQSQSQQQAQPPQATAPAQFSFGSSPAAVSAPTTSLFGSAPATATTTTAPSTGGLFGNLNKPAAATTPATSSTFNFGSSSTAAPISTPSTGFSFGATAPSTSTPAAATTTTAPLFKLDTTNIATATPTTTTTASLTAPSLNVPVSTTPVSSSNTTTSTINLTTLPVPSTSTSQSTSIQFPSGLKNKTIEEILTAWNEELENQVQEFQRQSVNLKEWDRKILSNAERVGKLNSRVSEMEQLQKNLEQGVNYVTMQQAELESLLDAIDRELPKMVSALGKTPLVGSDADRSKTFELAESLQIQLNDVSSQLVRLVNHVNTSSNPKNHKIDSPTTNVAQILNNHFETLQWIEEQVTSLQKGAIETQKLCERAHAEHERLSLTKNY